MTYKITSKCISCNLCLTACPTNAVKIVDGNPWIDPNLCTNCVGSVYTVPQCKAGCPGSGCVKQSTDYWDGWFATYNRLTAKLTKKENYWEKWFDFYSQKFSEQLQRQEKVVEMKI